MDKPLLLVASYLNPQDINEVAIKPDIYPQPLNMMSAPPLPSNFDISSGEPGFIKDCRKSETNQQELFGTRNFTAVDWKNYLYHYYRMIERVDREIGKIIVALENKGLDQNTIIVFTSVQGDGAAAHRWAGGYSPYEESVKTPFIICRFGKNLRNIEDNKHLVSGADILPTILDYAGIKIPENLEGMSLKTITEKPDTSWRKMLVTEIAPDPKSASKLVRMVRYNNYKYVICSYGTPNEQLFDLSADPGEMKNLAQDPRFSGVKQEIIRMLQQWMEWTEDR
jgi:arylsulfatase A-like enzyme